MQEQEPDWLIKSQSDHLVSSFGGSTLHAMGIEVSAKHFYNADDSMIGIDGEHVSVMVCQPWEKKTVGVGISVEQALVNTIERMQSLETIKVPSYAEIAMTDTASVRFARLESFAPKVSPGKVEYLVPDYLSDFMSDSNNGDDTYRNTKLEKDWHSNLRDLTEEYLHSDPDGQNLAKSLKIRSLSHLTPEQAVKLSAAFVQNVSKYNYSDLCVDIFKGRTTCDYSTAYNLLSEGMKMKGNPSWRGNGLCRTFAGKTKSVFEALKATQAEYSMLKNTYCMYVSGNGGEGYNDSRVMNKGPIGHAWNQFVTLDSQGSAIVTIVDPTWALGVTIDSVIEHLDQTEARTAAQLVKLFEASSVKEKAFIGLSEGLKNGIERSYTFGNVKGLARKDFREYAVTEYIKALMSLEKLPNDISLPKAIVRVVATQLQQKLSDLEAAVLLEVDDRGGGLYRDLLEASMS